MAHKLMILARTGECANGEGDIFAPERTSAIKKFESLIRSCGRETALTGQICPLHQNGLLIHLRSA